MSEYLLTEAELTAVANAIRSKGGTSSQLVWPTGFVSAIQAIPTPAPPIEIVSWSSGTDEQITAMIQAAHNGDIDLQEDAGWAVGDVRSITLAEMDSAPSGYNSTKSKVTQQNIDIVITSFDNYMNCGCVMQFDFKDAIPAWAQIKLSGQDNSYGNSDMKLTFLPAIVEILPSWLQDLLIEFSVLNAVKTYGGDSNPSIQTITGNKLALRSEAEIFGSSNYTISGEGTGIAYYVDSTDNRKKKEGHSGSFCNWWTRTTKSGDGTHVYVKSNGDRNVGTANCAYNAAPFGCI